jgi:hypothetical protein
VASRVLIGNMCTRRLIAPDSARFVLYPDDCPDAPTEHDTPVEEFNWAAMLNVLTAPSFP